MQADKDDLVLTENEIMRYIKTVSLQIQVTTFLNAQKLQVPPPTSSSLFGQNNQKAGKKLDFIYFFVIYYYYYF
jgi:hypothetical protein